MAGLVRLARRLRKVAPELLPVTDDFVCFVHDEEGGSELAARSTLLTVLDHPQNGWTAAMLVGNIGIGRPDLIEALRRRARKSHWHASALGMLGDYAWLSKQPPEVTVHAMVAPLKAICAGRPRPLDYRPIEQFLDNAEQRLRKRIEKELEPGSSYVSAAKTDVPEALRFFRRSRLGCRTPTPSCAAWLCCRSASGRPRPNPTAVRSKHSATTGTRQCAGLSITCSVTARSCRSPTTIRRKLRVARRTGLRSRRWRAKNPSTKTAALRSVSGVPPKSASFHLIPRRRAPRRTARCTRSMTLAGAAWKPGFSVMRATTVASTPKNWRWRLGSAAMSSPSACCSAFDRDRDGVIDVEDFLGSVRRLLFGSTRDRLLFAFRIHDGDRDGRLSRRELERMIALGIAEHELAADELRCSPRNAWPRRSCATPTAAATASLSFSEFRGGRGSAPGDSAPHHHQRRLLDRAERGSARAASTARRHSAFG